jgi:hypothetical protein
MALTPVNRQEEWYQEMINAVQGGGGSGGGGVLVVNITEEDVLGVTWYILDKTWQEIHDAFVSRGVVVDEGNFQSAVIGVGKGRAEFSVTVATQGNWSPSPFVADTADGYPKEKD